MTDRPLSYWISVARIGFENDFHRLLGELGISRAELARRVNSSPAYISKLLNGTAGNFQLSTMAKWARAIGAIVQIRLTKEGREAVRVVDYETASALDDLRESQAQSSTSDEATSNVIYWDFKHRLAVGRPLASQSSAVTENYEASRG